MTTDTKERDDECDDEELEEEAEEETSRTTFWEGAGIAFAILCFSIGFIWLIWHLLQFAGWVSGLENRISDLERFDRWEAHDSLILPGVTCKQEWNSEERVLTVNCE